MLQNLTDFGSSWSHMNTHPVHQAKAGEAREFFLLFSSPTSAQLTPTAPNLYRTYVPSNQLASSRIKNGYPSTFLMSNDQLLFFRMNWWPCQRRPYSRWQTSWIGLLTLPTSPGTEDCSEYARKTAKWLHPMHRIRPTKWIRAWTVHSNLGIRISLQMSEEKRRQ